MDNEKVLYLLSNITGREYIELTQLSKDTPLINIGFKSIHFIRFIISVEEEFNIEILDSDLLLSNFDTLEKIYITLTKYL